jgi:hypothetical protein
MLIAGLWGFAEATLFFLVPDIWLSFVAVKRGLRPGVAACAAALAGALAGGLVMYIWGAADSALAEAALMRVPAIDQTMISEVRGELATTGVTAIFLGPLFGIPYKIYAVEAASAGLGPLVFLLISIPARLSRFLLVTAVAWAASALSARFIGPRLRISVLAAVWLAFYAAYFHAMGF